MVSWHPLVVSLFQHDLNPHDGPGAAVVEQLGPHHHILLVMIMQGKVLHG